MRVCRGSIAKAPNLRTGFQGWLFYEVSTRVPQGFFGWGLGP